MILNVLLIFRGMNTLLGLNIELVLIPRLKAKFFKLYYSDKQSAISDVQII